MHRLSVEGTKESPAKHPTAQSRLHNFNFKSWGTQRHLRRYTNLHARKPTPGTEPASLPPWKLRARRVEKEEEEEKKRGEVTREAVTGPLEENFAERRVFCVTLLKEEIEEDIYALKGARPARRPRKRPRGNRRELDNGVRDKYKYYRWQFGLIENATLTLSLDVRMDKSALCKRN